MSASKIRPYFWSCIIAAFAALVVLYIMGALTPLINPQHFVGFTYLALIFPYLFIGMLVLLTISLFFFRKYSLQLFIIILLGCKSIFSTTGVNFPKQFNEQKPAGTIRLLSWNVDDFLDNNLHHDSANKPRRNILNFIKWANADVLCFQDFRDYTENRDLYSNCKYLHDTLQYPYAYFSVDDDCKREYFPGRYGTIILSKFPIIDSGRVAYHWKHFPEHLMYATINVNGKLIRFYNTHLRSMLLHKFGRDSTQDYTFVQDDTAIIFTGHRYQKLRYFDSLHAGQAKLVKTELDKCKLPYVFCADLNSVPSSYVYQHISKGLNDAFLQKGFGWGSTYSELAPTLRIDVALLSKPLQAVQYYSPKLKNASDHYPVLTDIRLN